MLSFQNGVLKNEQLARTFGWERVLGATAGVSAELLPDGTVHYTTNSGIVVGELPTGTSARVDALIAALTRAGFRATASPQIQTAEWSKYVVIVGTMGAGVLARLPAYQTLKDPDMALLVARSLHEAAGLAAALHIPLNDQAPLPVQTLCSLPLPETVATLQRIGTEWEGQGRTHKISALQDLERGRRVEVEEIMGYAVHKGAELGLPLPTLETCYRLMAGVNRSLQ